MKKYLIIALAATAFIACKKDDPVTTPSDPDKYGSGVLVTNEGVFQSGTGTLSLYNTEEKTIENEIYTAENGVPLGNIVQSATQANGNVYVVVNNSQQVVVADAGSMKYKATISGLQSPRYMHVVSADKAYVTDWGTNSVAVIDLNSNTVSSTITTGTGPESMVQVGNNVFVANSGGFTQDSTVTVINTLTDEVVATLIVGSNPNSLQVDANGYLWILCSGFSDWSTPANSIAGRMVQVDLTDNSVAQSIDFPTNNDHPAKLTINAAKTALYYLSGYTGSVQKMDVSSSTLPTSAFISGNFYGVGVHPNSDEIYTTDALDYNQRGVVYRYSNTAQIVDSIKAGIIPGGFLFR